MADTTVVLDNLLCFLIAKYGKTASQQLRQIILDFYQYEDIYAAKKHLLEAVDSWKSDIRLPHIPTRREGEQRSAKSLDDIFSVITSLDENLKLADLPKFVSESPDCMPSVRLCDGDLQTLTVSFEKLRDRLTNTEAMLAAILKAANTSRDMLFTLSVQSATLQRCTQPASSEQVSAAVSASDNETDNHDQRNSRGSSSHNWAAAVAAMSTPTPVQNRYAVLHDNDNGDDGEDGDDGDPFIVSRSRRSAKRRRRSQPSLEGQQQQSQQPPSELQQLQQQQSASQSQSQLNRRPGRGLLTGKLRSTSNGQRLVAAKTIVEKSVFCVDNVHISVKSEDLRNFVADLSVEVLSCFPVKPRRRRDETAPVTDRAAFRLCIATSDRAKLLNEAKWPQSVIISEWYRGKPGRRDPARLPIATSAAAAATDESGDNTVIYQEQSNDTATDTMDQDTTGVHDGVQTTVG